MVQNQSFLYMLEKLQDKYNSGEKILSTEIINQATMKYNNLVSQKSYYYTPIKKYLNLTTNGLGNKS